MRLENLIILFSIIFNHHNVIKNKMNVEMVLVGIFLFSGMGAAAVKIWLNKRKEKNLLDSEENQDNHA